MTRALIPAGLEPFWRRTQALIEALEPSAELAEAWRASFFESPALAGWINPFRTSPPAMEAMREALELAPPFAANALPHRLAALSFSAPAERRDALTHHAHAAEGSYYLQSLSSQWAVWTLDPQPHDKVLDLAAAPGGKTALIAVARGGGEGMAAVDPVKGRYFKLRDNLQRLEVRGVRLYRVDGRAVGAKTPDRFDLVLLDAPCSSEARIRMADPRTWAHWSEAKVHEAAHRQKALILSAFQALRPGGRLVYCTCSYAPEENEGVLAHLLARAPEASILPLPYVPPTSVPALQPTQWPACLRPRAMPRLADERAEMLGFARRVLPQGVWTGLFLALVTKSGVCR